MVTIDWSVNVSVDTVMKGGILGPYIVKERYVFMASHECQINASTNGLHPTAQEREEKDIGKKNILKIRKQSKLYLLSVVTNSKLDRNQISKVFFPCNGHQRSFHRPRALQKAGCISRGAKKRERKALCFEVLFTQAVAPRAGFNSDAGS